MIYYLVLATAMLCFCLPVMAADSITELSKKAQQLYDQHDYEESVKLYGKALDMTTEKQAELRATLLTNMAVSLTYA